MGLSLVLLALYVLSRPEINFIPATGILEIIEAKTLDLRFRLRGELKSPENIVIIADEIVTMSCFAVSTGPGRRRA